MISICDVCVCACVAVGVSFATNMSSVGTGSEQRTILGVGQVGHLQHPAANGKKLNAFWVLWSLWTDFPGRSFKNLTFSTLALLVLAEYYSTFLRQRCAKARCSHHKAVDFVLLCVVSSTWQEVYVSSHHRSPSTSKHANMSRDAQTI